MKSVLLSFLLVFSLSSAVAQTTKHEVTSLVYHRFGDDRFPSTNIKTETFEAHLKFLKEKGYTGLTISETADVLNSDSPSKKWVAITIDDGYKSFVKNGLPLLKKYGFKATLFINTKSIGYDDYMSWEDIAAARLVGVEIGNHSHSHPFFLDVSERGRTTFFQQELTESQDLMQKYLQFKPKVFAYPYGEHDEYMKPILKDMGFVAAMAQNSGVINDSTDLYQIPRFPMSEAYGDLSQFKDKMTMKGLPVITAGAISEGYNGSVTKPRVNIEFKEDGLFVENMQCFVQGSKCAKSMRITRDGKVSLSIRPQTDLKARRTLFTITIPDSDGKWHWYSYLWVMPSIK